MTPRATVLALGLLVAPLAAAGQPLTVLHVKVVLVGADGAVSAVPRHALLISDNPPTAPPRRVLTGPEGTVDVRLRPGSYTVESDRPVAFEGKAYQWTQMVEIAAGRDVTLELTAANAEVGDVVAAAAVPATPRATDPPILMQRWQDSVVTLWTSTSRALGFVVDAQGLVTTSQRGIGGATTVEVQLTSQLKVEGRVLAADPSRDVAVVWIDSTVAASARPAGLACGPGDPPALEDGLEAFAVSASARGQLVLTSGTVGPIGPDGIRADLRLEPRSAGGPVFTAEGRVLGIASPVDDADGGSGDWRVVGLDSACHVLGSARDRMRDTAPPSAARLPVEPARPFPVAALQDAAKRRGGAGPHQMSSSDFDVAFITPVLAYAAQHRWSQTGAQEHAGDPRMRDPAQERMRLLTDFGNWSEYVAEAPPVLLVRVTPRLVEGFWRMVGRQAARTQGIGLPPIKHFKPGFLRMRASCGTSEVTPIHAFTVEQPISESEAIREGLYVFDPDALGPGCGAVRLVLFTEKEPAKGDTRAVDAALLERVWQDFAPYRAAQP